MKFIGETFALALLRWKVMLFNAREENKVKSLFYRQKYFALIDKAIKKAYLFRSPFTISKEFLKRKNQREIHSYGETPLTVYNQIAKEVNLSEKDTFLELGCGRARGLFFLSCFYGCKAQGVDWIPEFIIGGYRLAKKYQQDKVSLILSDMRNAELSCASVIYLFGTCLSEDLLEILAKKLSKLPKSTQIVTVSFPLTDYLPLHFSIQKSLTVDFNWGTTDVFIQKPKS